MGRPWYFFVEPLRKHWAKKHQVQQITTNVKRNTLDREEAVVSSLAIHYADANIRARAAESKTLYNFGKKLHELYVKAGPSIPFESLFPEERICGRKKLTNRFKSISSDLQTVLR